MVNGQWSMVNGQWSMVNGQWSMVNGQWSMKFKFCKISSLLTNHPIIQSSNYSIIELSNCLIAIPYYETLWLHLRLVPPFLLIYLLLQLVRRLQVQLQ
jgi:hypothetical protein